MCPARIADRIQHLYHTFDAERWLGTDICARPRLRAPEAADRVAARAFVERICGQWRESTEDADNPGQAVARASGSGETAMRHRHMATGAR